MPLLPETVAATALTPKRAGIPLPYLHKGLGCWSGRPGVAGLTATEIAGVLT
jgi:hypothetical protein